MSIVDNNNKSNFFQNHFLTNFIFFCSPKKSSRKKNSSQIYHQKKLFTEFDPQEKLPMNLIKIIIIKMHMRRWQLIKNERGKVKQNKKNLFNISKKRKSLGHSNEKGGNQIQWISMRFRSAMQSNAIRCNPMQSNAIQCNLI